MVDNRIMTYFGTAAHERDNRNMAELSKLVRQLP